MERIASASSSNGIAETDSERYQIDRIRNRKEATVFSRESARSFFPASSFLCWSNAGFREIGSFVTLLFLSAMVSSSS